MSDPRKKVTDEPRPRPPEMDLEPIPLPDWSDDEPPLDNSDERLDEGNVPANRNTGR